MENFMSETLEKFEKKKMLLTKNKELAESRLQSALAKHQELQTSCHWDERAERFRATKQSLYALHRELALSPSPSSDPFPLQPNCHRASP